MHRSTTSMQLNIVTRYSVSNLRRLVLVLLILLGGATLAPFRGATATGPSIYWGALVNGQAPTSASLQPGGAFDTFETRARKKMSIIHWGQPWVMNDGSWGEFQSSYFDNVRNHGSIPMINWGSWRLGYGLNQPNFQLSDISSGTHDAYITRWATAAKAWGHPFFLRFDHEMNGYWYPWGEGKTSAGTIVNGNQPGDFVKAWRHVHDIFQSVGASNVNWVWCPNYIADRTPITGLYPGDSYVDWTCLDGYNRPGDWLSFNQVFTGSGTNYLKNSYQLVVSAAPSKPLMIAEFASYEAGDGGAKKAAWITDALLTQLPTNFPQIKAIVYFNWDDRTGQTWPIESSQAATNAFATGIAAPTYSTNTFANLNTSPIPPLGGSTPATTTLPPVADTYIDSSNPTSTAGGASTTLLMSSTPVRKAFLKFDLGSLAGKTLTSVKLRIHTTNNTSSGSASSQSVKFVNDVLWKEEYMSYSNSVPVSSTVLGTVPANTAPNTWYEITLTPGALQPRVGGLLSIAIESSGSDSFQFDSRQASNQPQLVISAN